MTLKKQQFDLFVLVCKQDWKCHYCKQDMVMPSLVKPLSDGTATVEHLVDKWSSEGHELDNDESNLVAACYSCNNSRGNARNKIARGYYSGLAAKKNVNLVVSQTPSRKLYKLFGAVPQHLFEGA